MQPEKHTHRPHDTAFKQQRLKAWQPILTPRSVILSFILVAAVFIPVGIYLKVQSDQVMELTIQYDGNGTDSSLNSCKITAQNQGYNSIQNGGSDSSCVVTFTITQDIPETETLQLFYQLTDFYQNHRRYVKSRSDDQLRGDIQLPASNNSLATACDPASSFSNGTKIYWPCGLIAQSYFNDGIILSAFNGQSATRGVTASVGSVTLNTTNIAWPSDLQQKFSNPTGANFNYANFQYIWQNYDQMSCYDNSNPTTRVACKTYSNVIGFPVKGEGCAQCDTGSFPEYQGGLQPPNGFQTDLTAVPAANSPYGVRSESFVVWMRTAGLPNFRKLFAYVTPPSGGFKKGNTLQFRVIPNFEVNSFGGTKSLVLSTTSALGGKNDVIGIAYLTVGSLCAALAIAFGIKQLVSPRKLGDTKYIVWRQRT